MAVRLLEEAVREELEDAKLSGWEAAVGEMENFLSEVQRVTATYGGRSGLRETTSLVVKCKMQNSPFFNMDTTKFFKTEIKVYKMLKALEGVLADKGKDLIIWPKLMGHTTDPYQIAMEDLKLLGYDMADKMKGLDLDHAILSVQTLAKLHALSSLLPQSELDQLSSHSSYLMSMSILPCELEIGLKMLSDIILESWGEEWTKIALWLQTVKDDFHTDLKKLYEYTKGKFEVMNHGDCWSNNIMFKYENGKPTHARLIDYQLCYSNSLVWDLTFLLYLSVQPAARQDNYTELLNTYLRTYRDTLNRIGSRKAVPTFDELEELMNWTLLVAMFVSCVSLIEISALDCSFENYSREKMADFFKKEWYINAEDRLKKDLAFFQKRGLFDNKFKLP